MTIGSAGQPSVVRPKALALQIAGFTDKLGYTLRSVARSISRDTQEGETGEEESDVKKKQKKKKEMSSRLSLSDSEGGESSSLPGLRHPSRFLGFAIGGVSGPLSSVHTHLQPKRKLLTVIDTTHVESSSIKLPHTGVEIGSTRIDRSHTNQVQQHTTDIDVDYQTAKLHGIGLGATVKNTSSSPIFSPVRSSSSEDEAPQDEEEEKATKRDNDEDAIETHPVLSSSSSSSTFEPEHRPLLEECFLQVALDSLRTGLRVATFNRPPSRQASSRALEILLHPYIPVEKLYEGLLKLEKDFGIHEGDREGLKRLLHEVREWAKKIWKNIYIEGLIQVNYNYNKQKECRRGVGSCCGRTPSGARRYI